MYSWKNVPLEDWNEDKLRLLWLIYLCHLIKNEMVLSVSPDMHRCEVVFSSELKGVYIGGHVVTLFHG